MGKPTKMECLLTSIMNLEIMFPQRNGPPPHITRYILFVTEPKPTETQNSPLNRHAAKQSVAYSSCTFNTCYLYNLYKYVLSFIAMCHVSSLSSLSPQSFSHTDIVFV
jgi:hypothetical protein